MHPLRTHYDKLLVAVASLLLGWGVVQTLENADRMRRLSAEPAEVMRPSAVHVQTSVPHAENRVPVWKAPNATDSGHGRGVDLFTAPVLGRDQHETSLVGSLSLPAEGVGPVLLAVKPEPFRFQLLGYVGRPGAYKVLLSAKGSAETLLVEVGRRLPGSTMSLKSFEVQRLPIGENEAGPIQEAVAQAVLQDEHTGTEVTLDSRGPCFTGNWLALVQGASAGNETAELGEGDRLAVRNAVYRVQRVSADPAEVVFSREAVPSETMTLGLARRAEAKPVATAPGDAASSHLAAAADSISPP